MKSMMVTLTQINNSKLTLHSRRWEFNFYIIYGSYVNVHRPKLQNYKITKLPSCHKVYDKFT